MTSCLVVQNDLKNYLRLTANKMRRKEATDKARNGLLQGTFETIRKEKKEKEDTLNQVKQNLETEKERTASLSKELSTLKEVFFATSSKDENRMQDWALIKELNDKLDKENKKVSNLEDSLKLLKEEVLTKNETVSRLEELRRNERPEEQKKASALELQLEEEKKKCKKLERDLMRQQQGNCFLEESMFESDKVEDQHDRNSHDEETTIEESIKVEVTEASNASGRARGSSKLTREKRKRSPSIKSKEEALTSQLNQHEISLTMIRCGISKLLQDGKTPITMSGPLKALKHCATFSCEDEKYVETPTKRCKVGTETKQEPKEEYFEYEVDIKREPDDPQEMPERGTFVPEDFLNQASRIATELQFKEQEGSDLSLRVSIPFEDSAIHNLGIMQSSDYQQEGEKTPLSIRPEKEKSTDKL